MSKQMATFRLAEHTYGIGVEHVQEVLRELSRTRVPQASEAVAGLVNLRGQVLAAIDLRTQFGLPARPEGQEPMVVVVRVPGEAIALLVDSVGSVVDVDDDMFETSPETLSGRGRELLVGAYKLPDRLLLALNLDHAVEV
jgi:purine-binding chemotaxis protein CheW